MYLVYGLIAVIVIFFIIFGSSREWSKMLVEYAKNGNTQGVIRLLKNKPHQSKYVSFNDRDIQYGIDYSFRISVEKGNIEMTKCLIENGANLNSRPCNYNEFNFHCRYNTLPLQFSYVMGNIEIVKLLINSGANIKHIDSDNILLDQIKGSQDAEFIKMILPLYTDNELIDLIKNNNEMFLYLFYLMIHLN